MLNYETHNIIADALNTLNEKNPQETEGDWLELLTVEAGPHIHEWDLEECWPWAEWPEKLTHHPKSTRQDVGIDVVARRRSDGEYVAIQCKARKLDAAGQGGTISLRDLGTFLSTSSSSLWKERWVVTNGDNPLSDQVHASIAADQSPIKLVNIHADLLQQQNAPVDDECPHCANPDDESLTRTKTCMQTEAIDESVRLLREHELVDTGGLPMGQARGRIILPCGTGKTRISLRIIERLTPRGELSIVLCPSIALVAQIRREYLQNQSVPLRALAVCSDQTAGYDPKKESTRNTAADPTLDNSNVSVSEVKGKVTTNPAEIVQWIRDGQGGTGQINVIFGTYQSGRAIADALKETGVTAKVLVADEAHRTAGLRRKKSAKNGVMSDEEKRIRDFTLCHENEEMPATYRIYQTATPRVYAPSHKARIERDSDWIVRSMDEEYPFGVELYRKSYKEAVENGWLADYRIIAVALNDREAYSVANTLARETESAGHQKLTTTHFLRGLAFTLAMGGAAVDSDNNSIPIRSCIGFMNTVDKSRNLANELEKPIVRDWLQGWLNDNLEGQNAADYSLEHLDAGSNVAKRENAKGRLATATVDQPHGILNVGIFGEGTDSPSLSAVAFLESRRSPIDVVQAVGRAMRTAPDKSIGYIICPFVIPPNADAETWLSSSSPEDGWQELGQILLALRAHDDRIEENLAELLQLYIPRIPEKVDTVTAIATPESRTIQYFLHQGAPGRAEGAIELVLEGQRPEDNNFAPLPKSFEPRLPDPGTPTVVREQQTPYDDREPALILTGKMNGDGSVELRSDTVARDKPSSDGKPGPVNVEKTKRKARAMINDGKGRPVPTLEEKDRRREKREQQNVEHQMRMLKEMQEFGEKIRMNLLEKSGLTENRVQRDLNILRESVTEAAHHLNADELGPALDHHFGLDNLKDDKRKEQADGCTIAALLMMNAAMLHQRIANGKWLFGVNDLALVKNDVNVIRKIKGQWNDIRSHDFRPVLEPAIRAIEAVEESGKLAGLERALRHIAAEAERIAETYADMGADHAGPLFNQVMGNQASDGAYFTRPVAASIAARLTLDALGDQDWTNEDVWRQHKTVDLACGSGTLLAAMLTDMKRRAKEQGTRASKISELQRIAVEDTIKGLDINPVSLQLAAAQLTAGNHNIRYRKMGLHEMPYGPDLNDPTRVSAGTLELLGQRSIVARTGEMDIQDEAIASQNIRLNDDDAQLEDAVDAVKDARIVIMNPPFTNRAKMGEKFPKDIQQALRSRADAMEKVLVGADPSLMEFADKNSIGPLFVALADHIQEWPDGVMSMINPTIALSSTSGLKERQILAQRFHIHSILTCHQPGNINMSQHTTINESIVVMRRHTDGPKPPTRFIHLDRMPVDESEVDDLHRCLQECDLGQMSNGWGEVSQWPADRMAEGNWTPAIWRSPELAEVATRYANHSDLQAINKVPSLHVHQTGRELSGPYERAESNFPGRFPILKSKGSEGQQTIQSKPDEYWIPKERNESFRLANGGTYPLADKILAKSAYLLVTDGHRNDTARLTATADDDKYVGVSWMPVTGLTSRESRAAAVFLNSTAGRLQIMSNAGRTLDFPMYRPAGIGLVRIPNLKDARICQVLADCWEHTKNMQVPQFRDGECEVRQLWDEAVAEAMGWDPEELTRLRQLLHNEPHVRGLGYNQYADEIEEDYIATTLDQESFATLAEEWEQDRPRGADIEQMANHSAYQRIIAMGEPAVPWILQRLAEKPDHWFVALNAITGARPVPSESRGRIKEMTQAWLNWGREQGYDLGNNQ